MNVKDIRRKNLRTLSRAVGGVTKLAERLEKAQSQISHLIGTNPVKNVGDKLAAHIEKTFNKPYGWLDQPHESIEEEGAVYQVVSSKRHYYQVPLITWQEAQQWFMQPGSALNNKFYNRYVVIHTHVSSHAFALQVDGDSMEAPHGISFPHGSIIILDPEVNAANNSFVLAKQNATSQIVFKQLIIDGNKRYLKPLNARYPIVEINHQAIICGIVRAMMMEFK